MTSSNIPCNKSSLMTLDLPRLLKIGSSKFSFWLLNLHFQLSIHVRKKVYCEYFDLKQLIAVCVPLLYAYFPTSSLTRECMLVSYEGPSLPFFLLKLSSLAFTADTSAAVEFLVALTSYGITI